MGASLHKDMTLKGNSFQVTVVVMLNSMFALKKKKHGTYLMFSKNQGYAFGGATVNHFIHGRIKY